MSDLISELNEIEKRASAIYAKCSTKAIQKAIEQLIEAADEAEMAHSGSWLGYHSLVYYHKLERPPQGAFFDKQWGLKGRYSNETAGEWVQYNYVDIFDYLKATETKPTFDELTTIANELAESLDDIREELLSIIEACRAAGSDEYLDRMKEEAGKARFISAKKFAEWDAPPNPPFTNDLTAAAGGKPIPPHVGFRASVKSARSLFESPDEMAKIAKRTAAYLTKRTKATTMLKKDQPGTRVFIGHGRSDAWLLLKNYIQDRLQLSCDDFNREATAGHATVARLGKMLHDACFAFIVLTAEDELADGKIIARQNVIHEAGLFQGKLGFEKSIVMLEHGCEEFSNIHGLGQIRFDKGNISSKFHEVSDTLKREGLA